MVDTKEYFLEFEYDKFGYGKLILKNDSLIALEYDAVTGYISRMGLLKNEIKSGLYKIMLPPQDTNNGWKARIFNSLGMWTEYEMYSILNEYKHNFKMMYICILSDTAMDLRQRIHKILILQNKLKIFVKSPEQAERKENMYSIKKGLFKAFRAGIIATGVINLAQGNIQIPESKEKAIEILVEFVAVTIAEFLRNFLKKKIAKK